MDQGPGNHQATLHATREHPRRHILLIPQSQRPEVLLGSLMSQRCWQAVITRLIDDNVFHFLELVEVEFLRHDPNIFLGASKVLVDIDVVDRHPAPGF